MSKKRCRRREIVNYCAKEYAGGFTIGNLILHRNNPIFKLPDGERRQLLADAGLPYWYYFQKGNSKHVFRICKKKFWNLNYVIIQWNNYNSNKKEMAEIARSGRAALLIKYIHLKRQETL